SFSSNVTVAQKPDIFSKKEMSSSDFIDLEEFYFKNGLYDQYINGTGKAKQFLTPVVTLLADERAGNIDSVDAYSQINAMRKYDVRNDLTKYMLRKAIDQAYHLSVSGGSKQMNYYLSAGYNTNLNYLPTSSYQRLTLNSNTTLRPFKNFQLSTDLNYSNNDMKDAGLQVQRNPTDGSYAGFYPYARLAGSNGEPLIVGWRYASSYIDTVGGGRLLDWHYRPLQDIYAGTMTTNAQ